MPFKPTPMPTCARCNKTVYQVDQLNCLDKIWHKACFTCEVCKLKLTMSTYKGFEKLPYCKTHYPTINATAVTDTPESLRLKKQSERQSVVQYHKAHEDAKGHYTATTSDPTIERVKAAQNAISGSKYDQRDGGPAPSARSHAAPAAAAAEEEHHEPPRRVIPAAAPVHHEPEPEPEPEPEHHHHEEAAHEEPAASSGIKWKALYDYEAADGEEVSFNEGDVIVDVQVIDEGWMRGTVERTGVNGMLPSNYVEQL